MTINQGGLSVGEYCMGELKGQPDEGWLDLRRNF